MLQKYEGFNGINIYVNIMLQKYEGFIMQDGSLQNIDLYNFAILLEDISGHSHSFHLF